MNILNRYKVQGKVTNIENIMYVLAIIITTIIILNRNVPNT